MNKIISLLKKDIMLSVSLIAAILSFFITPPTKEILHSIDFKTLATLFMLLTVLEGFKKENIFNPLLKIALKFNSPFKLTVFLVYCVFFSSMFVTNDVSLIIFVPITIILFRQIKKEQFILPVLTFENIAAVRGSLLTPFGSPQNLFLYTQSGISTSEFLKMMFPLWIFSFFLLFIFILFLYRKNIHEKIDISSLKNENTFSEENQNNSTKFKKVLYLFLFCLVIFCIVSRTKFWPQIVSILTIALLIFDKKILLKTDYALLCTFFCFFIFSSSISRNPAIAQFFEKTVSNHEYFWSIVLSQLISNVPASIVLWSFTSPNGLRALLYGLDSAGLCSIIGSLASVINLRLYTKEFPENTFAFLKTFTIISLIFFAIVVIPQLLLLKIY